MTVPAGRSRHVRFNDLVGLALVPRSMDFA